MGTYLGLCNFSSTSETPHSTYLTQCNVWYSIFFLIRLKMWYFYVILILKSDRKRILLLNDWYTTVFGHFFAICIFIFHKTEVQTVILRCLTDLKLEFWKQDSWFPSDVSKLPSVWNKLNLSLKYWCIEARLVFCTCYGPKIFQNVI